jgi:GntR family transcriptional regulator/MocR family aminotransferase
MTDSPVNTLLKGIHFDKSSASPVYIQISQQIINAIQRSYLAGGSLLPGTRIFSQLINVHRNTAVAVYDELAFKAGLK